MYFGIEDFGIEGETFQIPLVSNSLLSEAVVVELKFNDVGQSLSVCANSRRS